MHLFTRRETALFFVALLACGIATAGPRPVEVSRVIFDYPMTIVNSAELAIVRGRIEAGEEPQRTAYKTLLEDAAAALDFEPEPPAEMHIMGGYEKGSNLSEKRSWLGRESSAAYAAALAWLYSGEAVYAEKAASILEAWAEAGTVFTGHDRGLQLGSWFNGMLYAADILRGYAEWSGERRETFERWWRAEVLPHVADVLRGRNNNWKDAGLLGVITAAMAFEDRDLLGEALAELNSYFHARHDVGRTSGPDWKMAVCPEKGVYFPQEVTRNDGRSGVTYTAYTLTSLVQAMEMARYAEYDWWQRETESGATLKGAIAHYFAWNEQSAPFPWHEAPRTHSARKNPFEIANNHFPDAIEGLTQWLHKSRPVDGRQGDPYVTLNRGDISPATP